MFLKNIITKIDEFFSRDDKVIINDLNKSYDSLERLYIEKSQEVEILSTQVLGLTHKVLELEEAEPERYAIIGDLDLEESQSDKPSPKSSLTKSQIVDNLGLIYTPQKGYSITRVRNTNSMEPMLDDSDILVFESLEGLWRTRLIREPFNEGQVVVYKHNGLHIVHMLKEQVMKDGKKCWLLKGVNNFLPDFLYVDEDMIVSRLISINYGRSVRKND